MSKNEPLFDLDQSPMENETTSTDFRATRDTFLTFSELVESISEFVEQSAQLIEQAQGDRRSHASASLLCGTLSSTRRRAKHSLDALARLSRASQSRQLQFNQMSVLLREFSEGLDSPMDRDELLETIFGVDAKLQSAIEHLAETESDLEEALGQLLTIVMMMRRACSYVLNGAFDTG